MAEEGPEDRLAPARTWWSHHLAAVAALSAVVVLRWWSYLSWPGPLIDEDIYLRAFRAAAEGLTPFGVDGYYYPAAFASLGGWLLPAIGESGLRLLLRAASVAGVAVIVWIALASWRRPAWQRLLVGATYLALAPAVRLGFQTGNISFAVIAVILASLLIWSRHPVVAGLALGGSVAVKPLAPLALLAVAAHRPAAGGRRHWLCGALGAAVMAVLLLPPSRFVEMSALSVDRLPYIRSISLQRMLALAGIETGSLAIALALGVVVVVVARLIPMTLEECFWFAATAAVLATPVIWPHTLLITLPVQAAAIAAAWSRRLRPAPGPSPAAAGVARRYELPLVVLAVLALQLSEGAGAVDDRAVPLQLAALAVPYLAAPALAAYLLVRGRTSR